MQKNETKKSMLLRSNSKMKCLLKSKLSEKLDMNQASLTPISRRRDCKVSKTPIVRIQTFSSESEFFVLRNALVRISNKVLWIILTLRNSFYYVNMSRCTVNRFIFSKAGYVKTIITFFTVLNKLSILNTYQKKWI